MADPVNNFGPITPEQEAIIRRQAISSEGLSPLDLLMPGGLGAVAGRQTARGIGRLSEEVSRMMFPTIDAMYRMAGGAVQPNTWVGRAGAVSGGLMGLGVGAGAPAHRHQMNMMRDAEGQADGYYGDRIPTSRDAEGQPGGFYGKSREQLVRELMK